MAGWNVKGKPGAKRAAALESPQAKKPKKDVSVSFKQMDDDEEEEEEEKGKKMNGSSEEFHNNDNHKNEDIRKEANETNDKNTQL